MTGELGTYRYMAPEALGAVLDAPNSNKIVIIIIIMITVVMIQLNDKK